MKVPLPYRVLIEEPGAERPFQQFAASLAEAHVTRDQNIQGTRPGTRHRIFQTVETLIADGVVPTPEVEEKEIVMPPVMPAIPPAKTEPDVIMIACNYCNGFGKVCSKCGGSGHGAGECICDMPREDSRFEACSRCGGLGSVAQGSIERDSAR